VHDKLKYVVLVARVVLGGLFIYASIYKVLDPASFAQSVRNYMILPPELSNLTAMTLPWIELVAGTLLVLGIWTRPAALVITCLLIMFIPALFYVWSIGLDINCGCFSSASTSEGRISLLTIVRDSSLILVALFVLFADRGHFSLGERPRGSAHAPNGSHAH
jgi:uncharacterized membrane protein YphA (DoxX/SURF4 family)